MSSSEETFIAPKENIYTIYSKSGCPNCSKVKKLLEKQEKVIVDCDEYILENKAGFLDFIRKLCEREWNTFPMVFHNNKFIGGYTETQKFNEELEAFEDIQWRT